MNHHDVVVSTTEPAFSIDPNATILDWNKGAQQLFGYTKEQVVGKQCCDVLAGRDMFGNEYCSDDCPLMKMAKRHEAISRCELCFRAASGVIIRVGVSTMVFPGEGDSVSAIVHLVTPLRSEPALPAINPLTAREADVLKLLSDGEHTVQIAEVLHVSTATVRNHIQQILHKLHVHTRLEAVCVAWRTGLIDNLNDED